jgi:hypothetical protein
VVKPCTLHFIRMAPVHPSPEISGFPRLARRYSDDCESLEVTGIGSFLVSHYAPVRPIRLRRGCPSPKPLGTLIRTTVPVSTPACAGMPNPLALPTHAPAFHGSRVLAIGREDCSSLEMVRSKSLLRTR